MTRLDTLDAKIDRNVQGYMAHKIDHETFTRRQREAHDAIAAAGLRDAWSQRWVERNPIGATR